MRETLEAIAVVLVVVLQIIDLLLTNHIKKEVDELEKESKARRN